MSLQLRLVWVTWLACSACQTILSIEQAQVDPELTTESSATTEVEADETDDEATSADTAAPDAGGSGSNSSEPAPQCEGFDNSRVELLNADGTLPPLPEVAPGPPTN